MSRGDGVEYQLPTFYVSSIRAFRVQTKMANIPAFVTEFTRYRILYQLYAF